MKRLACMSRVSESQFAMSSAVGGRRVARGLDGDDSGRGNRLVGFPQRDGQQPQRSVAQP